MCLDEHIQFVKAAITYDEFGSLSVTDVPNSENNFMYKKII